MKFLTLDDISLAGKTVLVRSDLNVPQSGGEVTDDFRIRASIPTYTRLLASGARVLVCSHLGRPQGKDPEFSLERVAARMNELTDFEVSWVSETVGPKVTAAIDSHPPETVLVLENTRFLAGETQNAAELSDQLAGICDLFCQDAFGSVHRAHASTVGVAERVRSVAGPLLSTEIGALERFTNNPDRPYVVVMGGAKVSGKLGVIKALLPQTDAMLLGGGMCFTLLAAEGYEVGNSLVEEEMLEPVSAILSCWGGDKIQLPTDIVIADNFSPEAEPQVVSVDDIPNDAYGLDIGPSAGERFGNVIGGAASVFWNGPMGVFEWENYQSGTTAIAQAVTECPGFTVVGGGDSVAALRLLGWEDRVSHLSTGGGAGLRFLEGRSLPGVEVLERWA